MALLLCIFALLLNSACTQSASNVQQGTAAAAVEAVKTEPAKPKQASVFMVGTASAKITPPKPVPLSGYGDRFGKLSKGVHDDVYARAVAIRSDDTTLIMTSVDMCVMNRDLAEAARKKAKEMGCAVPDENILIATTHNHTSVGAHMKTPLAVPAMGFFDQKVFDHLAAQIGTAIAEATKDMKPASFGLGKTALENWNRNRRRTGGGLTDKTLGVLRFDGEDGNPIAIIVLWTAHPTLLDGEDMFISRDYPGAMVDAVSEHYASKPNVLHFNGAQGDASPTPREGKFKDRYEEAVAYGQAIAVKVCELSDSVKADRKPILKVNYKIQQLPPTMLTGMTPTEAPFQRIEFDRDWLLTAPGECICAVWMGIRARAFELGAENAFYVGLANEHLGYFVNPEQYALGGYEANMCFCGPTVEKALMLGALGDLLPDDPEAEKKLLDGSGIDRQGPVAVVNLAGSPYQIGFQHGRLLKAEIHDFWKILCENLIAETKPELQKFMWKQPALIPIVNMIGGVDKLAMPMFCMASKPMNGKVPADLLEEMRGLSEGADMAYDAVFFMNAYLELSNQKDLEAVVKNIALCTNIVTIPGDASQPVLHMRNVDWAWPHLFAPRMVVLRVKPAGGHAFLSLTWPGQVGVLTGLNDAGISLASETVNSNSDTSLDGCPMMLTSRLALEKDGSIDDMAKRLSDGSGTAGYHIIMADGKGRVAVSVDRSATKVAQRRREGSGNLLGVILEKNMPEPYANPGSKKLGITTIDEGERSKYSHIDSKLSSGALEKASVEDWQKFMLDKEHGLVKGSTIHATVMIPAQKTVRLHRCGVDGENYLEYKLE